MEVLRGGGSGGRDHVEMVCVALPVRITPRGTKYLLQAQHERGTPNSVFKVNTVLMEFLTGKISTKNSRMNELPKL